MKVPSRKNQTPRSNLTDLMIFKNRWWQHLIFWGVALLILFNIFKGSGSVEKIDVIYTFIFLVLLGGGALFLYLLFDSWIDLLLPGFYFISYYSVPVLMLYTGSFLVLTTLLKLSRSWFMLLRVERMTTTHQLQSLQSQINPHFLLNSRGATDKIEPEQQKGIGIDNTRKRLELLYPRKHTIDIETKEDTFTVNLSIELKQL